MALSSLPEVCFVFIGSGGPGKYVGAVKRGEMGYWATTYDTRDPEDAKAIVRQANAALGVSDTQAECMVHGSMFGWDTPGANPEVMEGIRHVDG